MFYYEQLNILNFKLGIIKLYFKQLYVIGI